MPFEILNRRASRATGVAINVSRNPKSKEGKGLSGFFRIAPDVVEQAGWGENTRLNILVGNGPDTGTFMLKPDPEGRSVPFKPKAGASLQLSFSAMSAGFSDPTEGTKSVDYKVEGDAIKVTVPDLKGKKR